MSFVSVEVEGYDGLYSVTDTGLVWSHQGDEPRLIGHLSDQGYRMVHLYGRGGSSRRRVHHLVLEAFVGPRPEGMECRHLNGNKTDNRLVNLAWGTRKENHLDNMRHGVGTVAQDQRGESNGRSKLTEEQVLEIRRLWDSGECRNQCELGRRFGVTNSQIHLIVKRKQWNHL